jgi:release factor glutamine methyltransferase
MTSIAEVLQQAVSRLGVSASARLDAEVLLAHVLGKPRSHLHAWPEKRLNDVEHTRYDRLLQRRAAGEPVAYLTGQREFWSLTLEVSSDTLIPRPDTEILVEQVLSRLPAGAPLRVADLGTGSGAIALALARERPHWQLFALDRSPACIAVARRNARRLGLDGVHCLVGDWSSTLAGNTLDAIVSNPPYVADADPHLLAGDVYYEPRSALASGRDGLDDIRRLAEDAVRVLRPDGHLFLEHAPSQTVAIHKLLKSRQFDEIQTARDLAGHERVTGACRRR